MASSASALLGEMVFDWEEIGNAGDWIRHTQLLSAASSYSRLEEDDHTRCWIRWRTAGDIQFAKNYRDSFRLIQACSAFKCTLPVDRIYGLLGLISDIHIEPDYSKTVEEVYKSVTRQMVAFHKELMILGQVDHEPGFNHKASWVPNWPIDLHLRPLNAPACTIMYQASSGESIDLQESDSEDSLLLGGVLVTRIASVSPIMAQGGFHFEFLSFCKEIVDFISAALKPNSKTSECYKDDDIDFVFAQTLTAGQSQPDFEALLDPDFPEAAHALRRVIAMLGHDDDDLPEEQLDTTEISKLQDTARYLFQSMINTCYERKMFITVDGHFGVGSRAIEVGDEISILFGGMTPWVLREAKGENEVEEANSGFCKERKLATGRRESIAVQNPSRLETQGAVDFPISPILRPNQRQSLELQTKSDSPTVSPTQRQVALDQQITMERRATLDRQDAVARQAVLNHHANLEKEDPQHRERTSEALPSANSHDTETRQSTSKSNGNFDPERQNADPTPVLLVDKQSSSVDETGRSITDTGSIPRHDDESLSRGEELRTKRLFVGECYVQGFMKGEIIKDYRKGKYEKKLFELL
jgi:hypothetical protein